MSSSLNGLSSNSFPSGPSHPLVGNITLGDFLQKVAMKSYEEIKLAIESFPAQSPELRAEKLLNLLNKSKKRFAQLYAILLWLHEDHVQKYLQSTNDLKYDLMNQTNRLNMKQDTLYYLHNNLYGKRIKSLEINESFHILLHEKYEKLPSSITLCRNLPTPPEQDHRLLIEQLNILIRSKLLLLEQLPVQYSSVNIMNGMLILTLDHYYEVILSLAHLRNYEAPWAVLSVRILTHNHESERLLGDYDPRDVNAKVLQILTKVVALENCKNPLLQIHRVCLYTAQSQSLRLLYVQALDMTRTSLIGIAEANYVELPDQIAFRCLFWKEKETEMIETSLLADAENSEKSSKYLYELTVSLMRPQQGKVHFHALPVLLFEVKEISSQTALFHDDISSNFEVFRLPNGEKFIEKGVSFGALYHSTLNLCSIRQLTSLYTVIRRSAILQQALSCGLILTGPETTAKISFTYKSVEVGIAISAKDGSFVVSSTSLAVVLEGHTSQICEALQIEINERYRTASSTPQPQDHDIRSWEESKGPVQQSQEAQTSTSHLVNLDLVIQLMFLSAVSQSIHAQLGIRSKRIFLDCPLSLHFPLFSWIDTDNSSCDDITFTTKKRHPTLAKQPQCTEFQVCLEFRLDPSTLGIHSYFALFQNCSTAPVKLATNHFISSAQSVVPLLYPKIISSRHLSSHMYDWDSLPLDTILADIRKCTPVESLRHFGAQYRLLKQSDSILSIPGEMTFYSHHFHVEGYQLHVMLSYSRACFVVAPSQRYPAEYTLENFTSLFAKLSDDHKVLLFSDRIHQLSVAVAEDNCICYLSESFDSSQPCLLGLPLLYVSHFLSQLEAWDYWIKSSHRKLSYIAAIPSSSEAFFTLTFLPTCFCVVPLQSPIVFSPLSLFSIDYSSALPDLVGCSSMSLYSRYILDVVGLGLQDVVISSSLSPHEYLTTISTLISPLITLFTSLLQHYSRIRSSIVVDNYSLWSLDDLMLEFIRGGHRYTVFIKIAIAQASPQSTELMCDCTLDDQTSEKISLSNLPDILEELISKSTPK